MLRRRGKRGESVVGEDSVVLENLIFIILNIVFAVILILFIVKSGTGAFVYESLYSKQITLMIDEAKPGTTIMIYYPPEVLRIANESGKNPADILKIDSQNNKVSVSLTKSGEYNMQYFSDYDVQSKYESSILYIAIEKKIPEVIDVG